MRTFTIMTLAVIAGCQHTTSRQAQRASHGPAKTAAAVGATPERATDHADQPREPFTSPAPFALVVLLDGPGANLDDREATTGAILAIADAMAPTDELGVVAFASSNTVVVPLGPIGDRTKLRAGLAAMTGGVGLDMLPALVAADRMLQRSWAAWHHVVAVTRTAPSTPGLERQAEAMARAGISISVVALESADRSTAIRLTRAGEGRLFMVSTPVMTRVERTDWLTRVLAAEVEEVRLTVPPGTGIRSP
jgi:hypothetical protein